MATVSMAGKIKIIKISASSEDKTTYYDGVVITYFKALTPLISGIKDSRVIWEIYYDVNFFETVLKNERMNSLNKESFVDYITNWFPEYLELFLFHPELFDGQFND